MFVQEMQYDETGFLKPHIIEEKCIHCNQCVKTCPAFNNADAKGNSEKKEIYTFSV